MIEPIMRALAMALAMGWEILWPLILGFALSAVVQAAVSHPRVRLVVMLLRGRGACPFDLPQGRAFHGRHGVRNGFDQSRLRAQHHYGGTAGLAVDTGRIRRRAADGLAPGPSVPDVSDPGPFRTSQDPSG